MIDINQQLVPRANAPFFKNKSNVSLMFIYIYLDAMVKENYSIDLFKSSHNQLNEPDYNKLTVIIPYRYYEENYDNIENLNIILEYLIHVGVKHVIISEEDEYPKISKFIIKFKDKFEKLTTIFTESHDNFNIAIAINEAVKKCHTPYVAIMDYNVLVPRTSFDYALSLVDSFYDFVYASNNYYKKISNKIDFFDGFNFDNVNTKPNFEFKLYKNILFCKKEFLMELGGYNNLFEKEHYLDVELLVRIILSKFKLFFINEYAFYLNSSNGVSKNDLELLINQYNLAKFNDTNILINHNEYLYNNSQLNKKEKSLKLKTDDYLISVIIPVYNCEYFYIDRCITSLKNQTIGFENIEVILVDDASIYQSSIDLINSYVKKYSNIKAIFLDVNSGAGIARNAGIKVATADYITFLDHDDYYVNNICEIAYNNISKGNIDIVITNFINLTSKKPQVNDWNFLDLKNGEKYLEKYSDDLDVFLIPPSTGTKTFRKEFLHNNQLLYKPFKSGQDRLFNEMTLFKANGIKIIDTPAIVYDYRYNSDENLRSTTLKHDKISLMDHIRVYGECYKLYLENDVEELINRLHILLDYWIRAHFLRSDLTKKDIQIIVNESYYLFNVFKEKPEFIKKYKDLYNAFMKKDYEKVHEIYKENNKLE